MRRLTTVRSATSNRPSRRTSAPTEDARHDETRAGRDRRMFAVDMETRTRYMASLPTKRPTSRQVEFDFSSTPAARGPSQQGSRPMACGGSSAAQAIETLASYEPRRRRDIERSDDNRFCDGVYERGRRFF